VSETKPENAPATRRSKVKIRRSRDDTSTTDAVVVKCPDCRARLRLNPRAKRTVSKCPRCECEMDFTEALQGGPVYILGEPRPDQLLGDYKVEKLIGRGGMGSVFQAFDPNTGEKVAIKVLRKTYSDSAKFRARFEREISVLLKLYHPNIVKIINRGEANGVHFFTMDLVNGVTLRDIMKKNELNLKARLQIIGEVCSAVQHAHDRNVIHRDLKPQNIIIDENGHARVLDFGIARLTRDNLLNLTRTGQIIGTSRYMAPEQQRDTKHVDTQADVYSIGILAYQLLTGKLPIGNYTPLSELVPQLPAEIDPVVDKALEVRPQDRYDKPERFWKDFERALAGRSRNAKRTIAVAAAIILALAALVGIVLWIRAASRTDARAPSRGPAQSAQQSLLLG